MQKFFESLWVHFQCLLLSTTIWSLFYLVLHPQHKLKYFEKAGWEEVWVTKAQEIVRTEFERSYKYSTDLGDFWDVNGTKSTMKVCYTIIFIQLLTKIAGEKWRNSKSSCIGKEYLQWLTSTQTTRDYSVGGRAREVSEYSMRFEHQGWSPLVVWSQTSLPLPS